MADPSSSVAISARDVGERLAYYKRTNISKSSLIAALSMPLKPSVGRQLDIKVYKRITVNILYQKISRTLLFQSFNTQV